MKKYQIELFYGYEEGECGIYHAFEATDPDAEKNDTLIAMDLAEQLDCEYESDRFDCNSMYIDLPETLIARIEENAVKAFCEKLGMSVLKLVAEKEAGEKIRPSGDTGVYMIAYADEYGNDFHGSPYVHNNHFSRSEAAQKMCEMLDEGLKRVTVFQVPKAFTSEEEISWDFVEENALTAHELRKGV